MSLLESIQNHRQRYRWHIDYAGIVALLFLLALVVVLIPLFRLAGAQYAQWQRTRGQLTHARSVIARAPELDAQNRKLASLAVFDNSSKDGSITHSKLLAALTEASRRTQIGFISIRPLSLKESSEYAEQLFRMELRASYHQIGRFLSLLGTMDCIVRVSDITMTGDKSGSPVITASLDARAFFLKTRIPRYADARPAATAPSANIADTVFDYKAKYRDPFLPAGATAASVAQATGASYRLKGVAWDQKKPLAVIMDGAGVTYMLRSGEQIGTDRVVAINKSSVTLRQSNGIRYELKTWE